MQLGKRILRVNVASVVACALLMSTAAVAEPTATELAVARRLFSEASALEQEQKWAAAAQKLREAIAIKDTPGLRFHLARCEEEQGQLVEALLDYDRAAELIQGGARAQDVERILPETRKAVQARIPSVTVEVPPDVTDAAMSVDGRPLPGWMAGQPAPLNPGRYRLAISAPGRKTFLQEVSLKEGQHRKIRAILAQEAAPSGAAGTAPTSAPKTATTNLSTPGSVDTSDPNTLRTIVIIGEVVIAAAGLGIGIGFKVAEGSASDEADSKREQIDASLTPGEDPNRACLPREGADTTRLVLCAQAETAEEDRARFANIATAGFITAGVGAAAAGLTLLLWPSQSTQSATRVHALPLHGGAAVGLSGIF